MSDTSPETAATPETTTADQAPEEWKPEPRKWVWKDLFTAPMLAFKPKCMIVSAVTLALVSIFSMLWGQMLQGIGYIYFLTPLLALIGLGLGAVIFSLGATLVSIFMKADLLDDEFLSLKEALGQYKKRILPAIMVPAFLVATVTGFLIMIYLGMLLCSIPYVGSIIYMLAYPLAYLLALLTVLVIIAVLLSSFLFPSIVSIRKHGWFDNVIDTFEAVGTKPHVVVLNIALTLTLVVVCTGIGSAGMQLLNGMATMVPDVPGEEVALVEARSQSIAQVAINTVFNADPSTPRLVYNGYYDWFTGLFTSFWKIPLMIAIIGYGLNVFLGGGMLTYLYVREDDYWDDEDLEDLDKLAKELEEEAKAEAAKAEADTGAKPETSEEQAPADTNSEEEATAADESEASTTESEDNEAPSSEDAEKPTDDDSDSAEESSEEQADESSDEDSEKEKKD